MTRPGGLNNERFDHIYLDVDAFFIPCSTMVLSKVIYDVLAGNTPGLVEYFADVSFGSGSTLLSNIDEINIDRSFDNIMGTMHLGFHTASTPIAGLLKNTEIKVVSGIRFDGKTAFQKRFHGRIEEVKYPSSGETRGTIDAFDGGKVLRESSCNAGTIIGDAVSWITNRCSQLDMGEFFQVVPRTAGINLANSHFLSYPSFAEAINTVCSGFKTHFVYFTGLNELVILDPAILSEASSLFVLSSAGVQRLQEIEHGYDRFNRIPYSNYTGYSKNFVTYQVNVQPDGQSAISAVSIEGNGFLAGVFNDTADQVNYGILLHPGVQNNICASLEELEAYCASVADESQREKISVELAYNPFIDLGNVLEYNGSRYVISNIRDRIRAGAIWKTMLELRKI